MTDINTRGKLPFTIVSSSVNTGYATQLTSSVGYNIDIVNHHKDEYGGIENSPLQGPFTAQHVGGNQHRHAKLNNGSDDSSSRPEAYIISASAGSVKVYGPDVNGIHKPRSLLTRDTTAKSPVNIKNIQTSGNIAGNFEHNYQVVQTSGRRITNNLINDEFIASGSLTTQFVSSSLQVYGLPEIENNSKSIFVERFNAPGGKEVSSRGALDREGEEYAPNNSLTTRNIKVRQPYYNQLTKHNSKFYTDSDTQIIPVATNLQSKIFSDSLSVSAQDTSPRGFYFKQDGTEFFIVGQTNNRVHRYSLSTEFEIATATHISNFSISAQTTTPRGVSFSTDGTKMFIVGGTGIYLYNLSSAWDITTAIFSTTFNFGVSPTGVVFDSYGTRLFISTTTGGSSIREYTLSSAWNITTPVLKKAFNVSDKQSTVTGIFFDDLGLELIICGEVEDRLVKYSLTKDRDLTSATYEYLLPITEEQLMHDVYVTPQKDKLFIIGTTNDKIYQYKLDNIIFGEHSVNKNSLQKIEQYDSNYITSSVNDNFWVQHSIPRTDLRYKWIADSVSSSQQPIEYQSYNLPYSISNSYNSNGAFTDLEFEQKGPFGDHLGISGAIDKDEMHVSTYTNTMYRDRKYFEFDATNTYVDLSNISSDITEKDFTISFWMKSDENTNFNLNEFSSSIAESIGVGAQDNSPKDLFFKPDGKYLYVLGANNRDVFQYELSIPWDLSETVNFLYTGSVSPINGNPVGPLGLYIKPDGTKLYITANQSKLIEFSLSTAWDIRSTGSAIQYSFGEDFNPKSIVFKPDGTKLYIVGSNTDCIYEKTLSTPWDLTTTGSAVSYSLATSTLSSMTVSEDGKRVLITRSQQIDYYTFNEPWDLSSGLNLISGNSVDLSTLSAFLSPGGMFLKEFKQKLYIVDQFDRRVYQYFISYDELPLLQYSGSSSDNNILLQLNPSSSNIILSGTSAQNNIKSSPIINDGKWHLITVVSDLSSTIKRIRFLNLNNITNTTVTKMYVDGGLATEATQQYLKLDISGLFLSSRDRINFARSNYNLHDIMLWDSILTEEQINEVYRVSNISYGQPKKYLEHKLDKPIIPRPKHVYSSRINKDNLTLADEVGSKNATLINFTASVNLQPQNTGIISYSTYFNGPYQGASWKSIRNAEHPVTRKLTTENTNIISTLIPPNISSYRGEISQKVVTGMGVVERIIINSRKNGTILNVKESPIYINNKPLKHKFILKDSQNTNVGFELTHTYANNLQYFASNQLNLTLGLGKKERQIYDSLLEYYNGSVDPNENPIDRLVGYTYNEIIFPKPGQALLKDVRQRTDYITDQPGYSIDGYDRQLGTQRVFWRNSQQDRMRTVNSYINSLGYTYDSIYLDLPFQTPSVAALEYISESNNLEYSFFENIGAGHYSSFIDFSYKNCSELFQQYQNQFTKYMDDGSGGGTYLRITRPVKQVPEFYMFNDVFSTSRELYNVILNKTEYPNIDLNDPASLRIFPNFIFEHAEVVQVVSPLLSNFSTTIYENTTNDLGLNRLTEKISGKNPWYDSYEDYYVDVKTLSNDNLKTYSKIPEFKISEQISQLVGKYGGDATRITLQKYVNDLQFNYKSNIDKDNNEFCDEDTINIVVDGVKKLLPYNGFYPQDRSLQLVNYLKESYLDTNAVDGGIYLKYGSVSYERTDGKLAEYCKASSFIEPLYAPGIFYNLIKSGIAVDWSIYTGSLPVGTIYDILTPLLDTPKFRISFEDLIDLKFLNSSSVASQNRFMKYREINLQQNAGDFNHDADAYFDAYFTSNTSSQSNPLYTLCINNFLAETINFFLKDSSLNTFISKPDSDFLSFQEDKTYYMDIVLRKNNITMCEAHSSSLADSFGKMSGRYFGPSFWTGSADDGVRITDSGLLAETLRDPGYCTYTPPYYYGDSIARISFKPQISSKYTIGEILDQMQIEFINTGFINDNIYASGSLYSSFVMPIESSVNIKGQIEDRQQTVQLEASSRNFPNIVRNNLQNLVGTAANNTGIKRWVISPKMETPVLDFSNQEFATSTNILTRSYTDEVIYEFDNSHTPPTASGFGRGMWSGYGEIPEGDKGIFLELKESYPRQLVQLFNPITRKFETTNTASLLQACGFQQTNSQLSKKIGELADSRDISEAIVIIPYLLDRPIGRPIELGGRFSSKTTNDTVQIEGHNFIKIDQQMFNYQKTNLFANKPAVSLQDYDLGVGNIQETSISRMIGLMSNYVLPPNFDFLINESISPFVMYIAEFTSNLDKQDLADVWQGVMPKIAMRAEREKQIISHKNTQFDFFHGQGLPKDVKFMIFKAKKRAEINYYKMTSDSSDDGLFPSIQAGKPPSPYSFNWPYDYCSLVETATVNVEIEYINNSGSNNQ